LKDEKKSKKKRSSKQCIEEFFIKISLYSLIHSLRISERETRITIYTEHTRKRRKEEEEEEDAHEKRKRNERDDGGGVGALCARVARAEFYYS